jgi:membrane-bound metal-dependent hydrolase YbcI (DUF457 family)
MWPWSHAAVGYLAYALYLRVGGIDRPTGEAIILLGLGTQLPDLIDKTLAWYADILPYGRSFAHSVVTGVPLVLLPLVLLLFRRDRRDLAIALTVGYLSHLVGDSYVGVFRGDVEGYSFLVWPLLPSPSTETVGLIAHLQGIESSPVFLFGGALTLVAVGLWLRDGTPGLRTLYDWSRSVLRV